MASAIEWTTRDISLERIIAQFGEKYVADIQAMPRDAALARCASRAAGAWNANEREHYAMYVSLYLHIEGA